MEQTNAEIAEVFHELADLLELDGGDPFRVRAFRRIGKALENLAEPAAALIRQGRLTRVPGIGEGGVSRIKEILRTGTCGDHRRLRKSYPEGIRELLRLKGLGPARVRRLYRNLGIGTLPELELAARSGRLEELPRMGPRSVQSLIHEIESHRRRTARMPVGQALPKGRELLAHLREHPDVIRADLAGSLRRGKATTKDLDLLVAATNGSAVVASFITHPRVVDVLSRGGSRASVRLRSGLQADLRILPPESYGAGLHYFTGSKLHNIAIRLRAKRRGLHISDHGVFVQPGDRRIASGETEEAIFQAVGLPWIPPELREDAGEIEAAEEDRLPRLVREEDLAGDCHLHTTISDGTASIEAMARAAIDRGLSYIAVTDHARALPEPDDLRARIQTVSSRLEGLAILTGVEVDIGPAGNLSIDPERLEAFDWVVASIHSHFDLPIDDQTARLVRAMETGIVDCIGHPTGRRLGRRDPCPLDMERVLNAALRTGLAMELNGNPGRLDLNARACRHAKELGVPVCLNTDAHSVPELLCPEFGVRTARRGWLEASDILNTRSLDELLEWRRDRLRRHGIAVRVARTLSVTEPAGPPPDSESEPELSRLLDESPLPEPVRERIERYLRDGDDPGLETLLAERADNPVQAAFNLLQPSRKEKA